MKDMDFLVRRPIAHRGYHDGNNTCFENSRSAFEAAIGRDFAIELDVRLSADGVVMVFHDDTLDRLTATKGLVAGVDAQGLRDIRLGTSEDTVPTLAEVLEQVAGRVPIVVEMKNSPGSNRELAVAVASEIASYDGPLAVMSFSHELIEAFRATGSQTPVGLTAEGISAQALAAHEAALPLGLSFVSYNVRALPNRFIDHVRDDLNMPVITWTVRTPEDVEATRTHADQMTFEGFDPDEAPNVN